MTNSSKPKSNTVGKTPTKSQKNSVSLTEKKERARWSRIKRVYGIDQEDYTGLDTGGCPICLRKWDDNVKPVVDHDHGPNGSVRGIVCRWCNKFVIGRLRDPDVVYRIYIYLRDAPKHLVVPKRKRVKRKKKI